MSTVNAPTCWPEKMRIAQIGSPGQIVTTIAHLPLLARHERSGEMFALDADRFAIVDLERSDALGKSRVWGIFANISRFRLKYASTLVRLDQDTECDVIPLQRDL